MQDMSMKKCAYEDFAVLAASLRVLHLELLKNLTRNFIDTQSLLLGLCYYVTTSPAIINPGMLKSILMERLFSAMPVLLFLLWRGRFAKSNTDPPKR